jgi:tetratricopeptide (TPR) repeat protein
MTRSAIRHAAIPHAAVRHAAILLACAVAAPLWGVGGRVGAQANANAIASLERQRERSPSDVKTLRALGVAYYRIGEFDRARSILSRARDLDTRDGVVALYYGLTAEQQGDLVHARDAYTRYLAVGRSRSTRSEVASKLAALSQRELRDAARAAIADEQRLASDPGDERTIAVLPFRITSTNPAYAPLGRGLADLIVSDLGRVAALTLLERGRVQALLDELALSDSGRVDAGTASRSGRLLRAGRMVTGTLDIPGTQAVLFSASTVRVRTADVEHPATRTGTLDQLFDLEKALVVDLIESMGVPFSAAERKAIDGYRPTRSIEAFLAYSRGLSALDAGRLDDALNFFDNARTLDPGFRAAAQRGGEVRSIRAGGGVNPMRIEMSLRGSGEGRIADAAEHGLAIAEGVSGTLGSTLADVNPSAADLVNRLDTGVSPRDPVSATTGQDVPLVRTGTITIIIRRP